MTDGPMGPSTGGATGCLIVIPAGDSGEEHLASISPRDGAIPVAKGWDALRAHLDTVAAEYQTRASEARVVRERTLAAVRRAEKDLAAATAAHNDVTAQRDAVGAAVDEYVEAVEALALWQRRAARAQARAAEAVEAQAASESALPDLRDLLGDLVATRDALAASATDSPPAGSTAAALDALAAGLEGLEATLRELQEGKGRGERAVAARADQVRHLARLRDPLRRDLAAGLIDPAVVRAALDAYNAVSGAEPDPVAAAVADEWVSATADLEARLAARPEPPTPEDIRAAQQALSDARERVQRLEAEAGAGTVDAAARARIEAAHDAVTEADRSQGLLGGTQARRRLADAEAELAAALQAAGFSSHLDFMLTGMEADERKQKEVARSRAGARDAEAYLRDLELALLPDPAIEALEARIPQLEQTIVDVLGFQPTGRIEDLLRLQVVAPAGATTALANALTGPGIDLFDQPLTVVATRWITAADSAATLRLEREVQLAHIEGQLEAMSDATVDAELAALEESSIGAIETQIADVGPRFEALRRFSGPLGPQVDGSVVTDRTATFGRAIDALGWLVSTSSTEAADRRASAEAAYEKAGASVTELQQAVQRAAASIAKSQDGAAPADPDAARAALRAAGERETAAAAAAAEAGASLDRAEAAHQAALDAMSQLDADPPPTLVVAGAMADALTTIGWLVRHDPAVRRYVFVEPLAPAALDQLRPSLAELARGAQIVCGATDPAAELTAGAAAEPVRGRRRKHRRRR